MYEFKNMYTVTIENSKQEIGLMKCSIPQTEQ
jgi:hypothetical protein